MEKENITNRLKNLINWSKNISNVTISDIKYKLTDIKEIHEELLFLHINQTLGMVKISDCVHILKDKLLIQQPIRLKREKAVFNR